MMEFMPKRDYDILVDARTLDHVRLAQITAKLAEIASEKNIGIVTVDNVSDFSEHFDRDRLLEYCLHDLEAQRSFCDHIHNLERIERRRRLRHVPRGQRNKEPQRRKAYRGKRRLPTETSVQLLERDFISFRFLKNRTGQEGMAAFEPISKGRPLGKISLFHQG